MSISIIKWFKNISITKKLYSVVGIMALLIAIELFTLWFSLTTLSSVRACVGAEGLWSKAQKDAVYYLQKYFRTHDDKDYTRFQEYMKIPYGDHKTLLELKKPNPDMELARQGFLEGGNHPHDIDGMIKLFRRFHNVSYIKKAVDIWTTGDSTIMELTNIGEELRKEINSKNSSREKVNALIAQIEPINGELTLLENQFSYTLGEGARWLENLILTILFVIALTVELSGLLLTIYVSMGITKGISEIAEVSNKVSNADFSERAKIYSQDEIGQLAGSFNKMINNLEENINERIQVEERIKDNEQQIQTIFDNAPDGIIVIDTESTVVRWNPVAEKIFGWEKEEIIGKPLHEFIIPTHYREAHLKGMKRFLSTGEGPVLNKTIEIEALNKKGILFNISLSISPSVIKERYFFIAFIRDITKRKQMEEEIQRQQQLYGSLIKTQSEMGQGIAITENQQIIYANDALCRMYGYDMDEILTMPSFINIVIPEDRERLTERLKQRLGGTEMGDMGETTIIRKDGKLVNIEYSLKMIKVDGRTQILSIIRDITSRKKAAEELRQKTEELVRSNNELEQFAYITSHDLQEPLRMVTSYVQLLENRYKNKLDADADEFMHFALDGADRMRNLIHSLLEYSRINKVKPFEIIDTNKLLNEVLNNLEGQIKENNARIKIDGKLPDIYGDNILISQLFQNLISNAIKFKSSLSPEIKISGNKINNECFFTVKDNGIGIQKEYAEKIFVIFQRLHTKEEYPGTGIGLAICKKIVEKHGGKIWMESEPGKGSSFHFTVKDTKKIIKK
ncbi:MAG: PAS domain S-box protein [Bacteroidota bacterium]